MLELKKGDDILANVGGVKSIKEAHEIFNKYMDDENKEKLLRIKNEEALVKIANGLAMAEPESVMVNTGSPADLQYIRDYSLEKGEEKKLAMDGHTVHFDLPEDQARLINQTYYIISKNEKINESAKFLFRDEAMDYVQTNMKGIMKGLKMMIGFYSRGPIGAQASTSAIEMSSSTYVLHSAELLYRNCFDSFDKEVERRGIFYTNIHSEGKNRSEDVPNARIFMDRSWQTTFSTFCTYAGNTLLLKKGNHRFSVDYATYHKEGTELSEHMFITGLTGPGNRKTFFAGAAPSGCGKTTTAMVGTDFIGDDLAQIWIDDKGICRAVNPEKGIFGIVEDVNEEGDPHLMKCLRQPGTEVVWSNVLIDDKDVPHWVGHGEKMPEKGINFQGEWVPGKKNKKGEEIPASHKNSRCTLLCSAIKNHNEEMNQDPTGAPVKVVTYSGRDADTMPPVWVAEDSDHGVVIGASLVSKATATEIGATGVRRQPWANAPFIPGPFGDYMRSQFNFFNNSRFSEDTRPVMSGLNYFLTHESRGGSGSGLLGEKKDVYVWLGWLELYAHGDVDAIKTPIGFIPKYEDLKKIFKDQISKEYTQELYNMQFAIYIDNIVSRIDMQNETYSKIDGIPKRLFEIYADQKKNLLALKDKEGAVVLPEKL